MAQHMIERLHAGPVVRAAGTTVITVSRLASTVGEFGAVGAAMPVAVVVIAGADLQAWRIDGQPESIQRLLENVPHLANVIDSARITSETLQ